MGRLMTGSDALLVARLRGKYSRQKHSQRHRCEHRCIELQLCRSLMRYITMAATWPIEATQSVGLMEVTYSAR